MVSDSDSAVTGSSTASVRSDSAEGVGRRGRRLGLSANWSRATVRDKMGAASLSASVIYSWCRSGIVHSGEKTMANDMVGWGILVLVLTAATSSTQAKRYDR